MLRPMFRDQPCHRTRASREAFDCTISSGAGGTSMPSEALGWRSRPSSPRSMPRKRQQRPLAALTPCDRNVVHLRLQIVLHHATSTSSMFRYPTATSRRAIRVNHLGGVRSQPSSAIPASGSPHHHRVRPGDAVTVRRTVKTFRQRHAAIDDVRQIDGVSGVDDQLASSWGLWIVREIPRFAPPLSEADSRPGGPGRVPVGRPGEGPDGPVMSRCSSRARRGPS